MFAGRHGQGRGESAPLNDGSARPLARVRQALAPVRSRAPRRLFWRPGAAPLVAFVHVPKTAGATVTSMLMSAYSRQEVRNAGNYLRHPETTPAKIARTRWRGARVAVGHIPYGLFRRNLPRDTRYMTFLRDPIDRVPSHYYAHIERKSVASSSLEEALESGMPEVNNLATRFLCGDPSPLGDLDASALDGAKANLREFAFVGMQERFEESIALLQRALDLGPVPYLNVHVGTGRPAEEEVSDELRALIFDRNQLDAELHSFALGLFDEAVTAADERFADEVEAVRSASVEANVAAIQMAREWLDRELPPGSARPREALYSAAEAAGVPWPALKHVIARTSVTKEKDGAGQKVLARS
jgi:hypothetical protein